MVMLCCFASYNLSYYGHKHKRKFYNITIIAIINGSGSNNIKQYEIQKNPVEKLIKQKVDANIWINIYCSNLVENRFQHTEMVTSPIVS